MNKEELDKIIGELSIKINGVDFIRRDAVEVLINLVKQTQHNKFLESTYKALGDAELNNVKQMTVLEVIAKYHLFIRNLLKYQEND